jgi:hypothetical protein
MASNGQGEITAVKNHLELAEKAAKRAAANRKNAYNAFNAAQKAFDAASLNLFAAKKEETDALNDVKDAEKLLKDVEKKWELIDVDGDDDISEHDGNAKKRAAVSTTEQTGNRPSKKAKKDVSILDATTITIRGCGVAEANGTYTKPLHTDGALLFEHRGKWMGNTATFRLLRSVNGNWRIDVTAPSAPLLKYGILYKCEVKDIYGINPLNKEWSECFYGLAPSPRLEVEM